MEDNMLKNLLTTLLTALDKNLSRRSVLTDRLDKINLELKRGYKLYNQKNQKGQRKVKLSEIQKTKLEEKIPLIKIELFDLETEIKKVKYQITVERKKNHKRNKETLKNKVKKGIETLNTRIYNLFEMAIENGSINELREIQNNLSGSEYGLDDLKKDILPILNKYNNVDKYPPIRALRKHVAEELQKKIEIIK